MHRVTNTMTACASCKHQRKKCTDKCVLAPFFPVDKSREFQAVHKVFGVSNITKIIVNLKDEQDRKRAVDSLVWEALCRHKDPVLGPYGEYRRVCDELRLYKSQYHQNNIHHQGGGGNVYKATTGSQGMVGWNNNTKVMTINGNNNKSNSPNIINNIQNNTNGNSLMGYVPNYGYSSYHIQESEKIILAEGESNSALIQPHQHLGNSFNQHYFFTGQYNIPPDSKSMESTLWDGSS